MRVNIIVAFCRNRGIGINNKLPWYIPEDLKRFSKLTKGNGNNAIVMGRKTYESISKALPGRLNIVLSKESRDYEGVTMCTSLEDAIVLCENKNITDLFIIGGESLYKEALEKKLVYKVYETVINGDYECDTFFPDVNPSKDDEIPLIDVYFISTSC